MASRTLTQSARRFALAKPSSIATCRALIPAASTPLTQNRPASISSTNATTVPRDDSMEILVRQRLNRPVAPHLSIYQPQITWTLSALNRITGSVLSGGLYIFGLTYLAAPLFGWSITSAAMAAGFAKWGFLTKVAAKSALAWPFVFHCVNGVRHLVWDAGRQITNVQVIRTGWAVVGLSVVGTLGLVFFV